MLLHSNNMFLFFSYHPYTLNGKLVVNGYVVSVHSMETDFVPHLSILGLHYDTHQFQQLLFAPLRLLYRYSPETYSTQANHDTTGDGSHHYVDIMESLLVFLLGNNKEHKGDDNDETMEINFGSWSSPMLELRVPILCFLLGCQLVETTIQRCSITTLLLIIAVAMCVVAFFRRTKKHAPTT